MSAHPSTVTPELEAMALAIANHMNFSHPRDGFDTLQIARTALMAIREPSAAMFNAALLRDLENGDHGNAGSDAHWQAMIDHILGFHLPPKGKR